MDKLVAAVIATALTESTTLAEGGVRSPLTSQTWAATRVRLRFAKRLGK